MSTTATPASPKTRLTRAYRPTADDVVITDDALWFRDDAEFFASVHGTAVQFPPTLTTPAQREMAHARFLAMQRGERFDPVRHLHERACAASDLDSGVVSLAIDFYSGRSWSMLRSEASQARQVA